METRTAIDSFERALQSSSAVHRAECISQVTERTQKSSRDTFSPATSYDNQRYTQLTERTAERKRKPILQIPKPKQFWPLMTCVLLYSIAATFIDLNFPHQQFKEVSGITITGVIMGLLLAFRTNTAYDRWWEGRKLWGQLVNDSRNLCLKARNYLSATQEQRREFSDLIIAFPYALKEHLRGERPSAKVTGLIATAADAEHVPLHITDMLFLLAHVRTRGSEISAMDRLMVDPHLRALMDICGACERIKNSPIVQSYKHLIWILLGAYLLILPWALAEIIYAWTIPITLAASFFAITLELTAEEIEQPFGYDGNDLPLDDLCQTIEKSIRQLTD